jgi:glucuronate isomerase
MQSAGVVLHRTLKDLPLWALSKSEKYWHHSQKFQINKTLLTEWRPDALVLIDYPGFNLKNSQMGSSAGHQSTLFYLTYCLGMKSNRAQIIKESRR